MTMHILVSFVACCCIQCLIGGQETPREILQSPGLLQDDMVWSRLLARLCRNGAELVTAYDYDLFAVRKYSKALSRPSSRNTLHSRITGRNSTAKVTTNCNSSIQNGAWCGIEMKKLKAETIHTSQINTPNAPAAKERVRTTIRAKRRLVARIRIVQIRMTSGMT